MKFWIFFSIVFALIARALYRKQNQPNRMGGPISMAKGFWLSYTIYTWFLFVPFLLIFMNPPDFYRSALTLLAISMWVRGVVELYMLFVSKNWVPPIGMSHDVLTIAGMIAWPILKNGLPTEFDSSWTVLYLSLLLSLVVETYYAYAFFSLMRGKTKGEEGVWYASDEDPIFKRINNITTTFNFILYAVLIYFISKLGL